MMKRLAVFAAAVAVALPAGTAHASGPPPGASAKCRDGTYSFSHHRRGTCSHHHGVAKWLRNIPK
jgi:hypothetical protein